MTRSVDNIIHGIIRREGGYVDNPNDKGGPTRYGITQAVARQNGYTADMKDLPEGLAWRILKDQYYFGPRFDRVAEYSEAIAEELTDTGVNMGPAIAVKFLQRILNVFNRSGALYPDIQADGYIGNQTVAALSAFLHVRQKEGEVNLLKALNGLQCARYIELAEARERNESFVYGWIDDRIVISCAGL